MGHSNTMAPSVSPQTMAPSPPATPAPAIPATPSPTPSPVTPVTAVPTPPPTLPPTKPFSTPTPSAAPTPHPSAAVVPTPLPTLSPTPNPTPPTLSPTPHPTKIPTVSPTPNPTSSPTATPTSSPTSSPTDSPTPNPTATPTSSPTSSPTGSPTPSPTPNPTAAPTGSPTLSPSPSPTPSPTPEEHENCMLIKEGELTAIEPSATTTPISSLYSSQCIMVPAKKNVIRVSVDYSLSLPATNYRSMLITSFPLNDADIFDYATNQLKNCVDICVGLSAADCLCVEGAPRKQPTITPISSIKSLYFMTQQIQPTQTSVPKYFTIFSDVQRNIQITEFSIHGSLLQTHPISLPLVFPLAPNQVSNALLTNVEWVGRTSGHVQKLMLKLPREEEDGLLQLTATPLFYSEDESLVMQNTQRCLLDDDPMCHIWLNPSLDYNVELENIGRINDYVELTVVQYPVLGHGDKNVEIDIGIKHKHSAIPMKYLMVGVAFIFIWVLAILLIIAAVKKGNKTTQRFVNGMTGIFTSKKRKHYLQQAYEELSDDQQQRQQRPQGYIQA